MQHMQHLTVLIFNRFNRLLGWLCRCGSRWRWSRCLTVACRSVSICVAPQEVVVGWQLLPCTVLHGVARLDVERFNGVVPPWLQVPRPLLPYRKMHK